MKDVTLDRSSCGDTAVEPTPTVNLAPLILLDENSYPPSTSGEVVTDDQGGYLRYFTLLVRGTSALSFGVGIILLPRFLALSGCCNSTVCTVLRTVPCSLIDVHWHSAVYSSFDPRRSFK